MSGPCVFRPRFKADSIRWRESSSRSESFLTEEYWISQGVDPLLEGVQLIGAGDTEFTDAKEASVKLF